MSFVHPPTDLAPQVVQSPSLLPVPAPIPAGPSIPIASVVVVASQNPDLGSTPIVSPGPGPLIGASTAQPAPAAGPSTPPRMKPASSASSSGSRMSRGSQGSNSKPSSSRMSATAANKPVTPRAGAPKPPPPAASHRGSEVKRRDKATFTTCLSYPEEPIVPISTEPEGELQRNQRKSKVQAISKLDRVGAAPLAASLGPSGTSFLPASSVPPTESGPGPSRNPLHRPPVRNPPFNIDTVRTSVPRRNTRLPRERLFGIQECATYYPSAAEFQDALGYIASLPPEARATGICKIVPPEGWRMPFKVDTDTFRFKTRLQRLNSLEAASRARINFLEQLTMFHLQQGDRKVTIPVIDKKPLDLWQLRKDVTKLGGYEDVNKLNAWENVTEMLGHHIAWANDIRDAYRRIIYPFDTLSIRAKSASVSPLTPLPKSTHGAPSKPPGWVTAPPDSPTRKAPASRMGGMKTRMTPAQPPTSALGPALVPTSVAPAAPASGAGPATQLEPSTGAYIPGFSSRGDGTESDLSDESLSPPPSIKAEEYQKGEICEVCRKGNHGDKILLCDGCDRGFHIFCLDPPLAAVPTNEEWFCTPCLLSQGDDYGFEEGSEHSIASFAARDAGFSNAWWSKHRPAHTHTHARGRSSSGSLSPSTPLSPAITAKPPSTGPDPLSRTFGRSIISEDDVEREFWRLTESNTDTVEIEYGADVHSTTHGSAAPTLETFPLDPYSKDQWNLNNMPILPDSLLRYIKSDISGMTVPWIYIGMLFSAFCWHNEDHYTYSVNYMYWGETKTWYGIPGSDAEKFETAIKAEAPELFEQQPSLLYQLVTMMNPGRLVSQGVKVSACDQRPNEFVVTWPKAYHCGFNHGINFNEAVNFALPDWLADGKEAVMKYREHAKPAVFSHNELLISITLYSDTIKTALWLRESLSRMVQEESERRSQLRAKVPQLVENLVEEDCPEEQYQCHTCKAFSYLSQVTCSCTKLVSCIPHADSLCKCAASRRVLRKRYSEAQLEEILAVVEARAGVPAQWRARLQQVLSVPRPQLKTLRGLLTDGEKIAHYIPEVDQLRAFVERANAWVEKVSVLSTRKGTSRRRRVTEEDRSPEFLSALLAESDRLAFDSPEVLQLRQMLHSIQSFKSEANLILSTPEMDLDLERCRTALILGDGLQVDLPELARIERIVKRLDWFRKVENDVDDRTIQYADVVALLAEAKENGIPERHELVQELSRREYKGRLWKQSTARVLDNRYIELADLELVIDGQELTPTDLNMMLQLQTMRKTAQGWQHSAGQLLSGSGTATAAMRLIKAVKTAHGPVGRIRIPEMGALQEEMSFHAEWQARLGALLREPLNRVDNQLKIILAELNAHLHPDDVVPNDARACFCRQSPGTVMVKCDTCQGLYHPKCVNISPKQADGPFKCLMCSRASLDDRASLHALLLLADASRWNFVVPPTEWATLNAILQKGIAYSRIVIPIIHPRHPSPTRRDFSVYAHHARKLFTLPVSFDALDAKTNERIVFEEWLFKRMREVRQLAVGASGTAANTVGQGGGKKSRSKRPKLVLEESKEKTFRCICTKPPADELLQVWCSRCEQGWHISCVGVGVEFAGSQPVKVDKEKGDGGKRGKEGGVGGAGSGAVETGAQQPPAAAAAAAEKKFWRCPCCAVKEGKVYLKGQIEVRVQSADQLGTDKFIDYQATLTSYLPTPVIVTLPPAKCILLHCTQFIPGTKGEDADKRANGTIAAQALPKKEADDSQPGSTLPARPVPVPVPERVVNTDQPGVARVNGRPELVGAPEPKRIKLEHDSRPHPHPHPLTPTTPPGLVSAATPSRVSPGQPHAVPRPMESVAARAASAAVNGLGGASAQSARISPTQSFRPAPTDAYRPPTALSTLFKPLFPADIPSLVHMAARQAGPSALSQLAAQLAQPASPRDPPIAAQPPVQSSRRISPPGAHTASARAVHVHHPTLASSWTPTATTSSPPPASASTPAQPSTAPSPSSKRDETSQDRTQQQGKVVSSWRASPPLAPSSHPPQPAHGTASSAASGLAEPLRPSDSFVPARSSSASQHAVSGSRAATVASLPHRPAM